MKVLGVLIGIIVIVVSLVFGVLFTQVGNDMLKPILETKTKEALQTNVKINEFSLRTNSLKLDVSVDNNLNAVVGGAINIFSQSFDIAYKVEANGLVTPVVTIKDKMSLDGKVVGDMKYFSVEGKGYALGSDMTYSVALQEYALKSANVIANNIKIGELLELAGQPKLATGLLSLNATSDQNANVIANLDIANGKVDEKLVKEHYGVELGSVNFVGKFAANYLDNKARIVGFLNSSLANIELKNSNVNLGDFSWDGALHVDVSDLSKLSTIANMPLASDFRADIEAKGIKANYEIVAKSSSLGGELKVDMDTQDLKIDMKNLALSEVLKRVSVPKVAEAKINSTANLSVTKEIKFDLKMSEGVLYPVAMKDKYEVNISKNSTFEVNTDGDLKDGAAIFKADVLSNLADFKVTNGHASLRPFSVSADYEASVSELANLEEIVGYKFNGPFKASGKAKMDEANLYADGKTDVIGGVSSFVFDKSELNAKLANFTFEKISSVAGVPYMFESVGNANLNYNLLSDSGKFDVIFPEGKLLDNQLTNLILLATRYNLAQDVYKNTSLIGTIEPKNVKFDFDMSGESSFIKATNGHLERKDMNLNVPFSINVQNKDFAGEVKGSVSSPSVKLTASKYLDEKIDSAIDKHVPEDKKEAVKNILNLFK